MSSSISKILADAQAEVFKLENQMEDVKGQLKDTKLELKYNKVQLEDTKPNLEESKTEISKLEKKLAKIVKYTKDVKKHLKDTNIQLKNTKSDLKDTNYLWDVTKTELEASKTEIFELRKKLAEIEEYDKDPCKNCNGPIFCLNRQAVDSKPGNGTKIMALKDTCLINFAEIVRVLANETGVVHAGAPRYVTWKKSGRKQCTGNNITRFVYNCK